MIALVTLPILFTGFGYIFKNDAINDKYEQAYIAFMLIVLLLMVIF